jgi:hypothetical protein
LRFLFYRKDSAFYSLVFFGIHGILNHPFWCLISLNFLGLLI